MIRGLGYVQDAVDSRDWPIEQFGDGLYAASKASLVQYAPSVLDQGRLNSCVAHAVASVVYICHGLRGDPDPDLCSILFLWNLTRATEGTGTLNSGTSIRDCLKVLNDYGFCKEEAFPYDDRIDNTGAAFKVPPLSAIRQAFDQRVKFGTRRPAAYARLYNADQIKTALTANFPVILGLGVDIDFQAGRKTVVDKPMKNDGGHCMTVIGFEGDLFRVRNSWGKSWGDDGDCYFTEEALDVNKDVWMVTHAPEFSG